jgi:hypothetical protein
VLRNRICLEAALPCRCQVDFVQHFLVTKLQTSANYRIAVPGIKSLASVFEKKSCRRVEYATVEKLTRGVEAASANRSAAAEKTTGENCDG